MRGQHGVTVPLHVEEEAGKGHGSAITLNLKVAGKTAKDQRKNLRNVTLSSVGVSTQFSCVFKLSNNSKT